MIKCSLMVEQDDQVVEEQSLAKESIDEQPLKMLTYEYHNDLVSNHLQHRLNNQICPIYPNRLEKTARRRMKKSMEKRKTYCRVTCTCIHKLLYEDPDHLE